MSLNWDALTDKAVAPEIRLPQAEVRPAAPRAGWRRRMAQVLLVVLCLPVLMTAVYAFVPPVSTLMLARWATLRNVDRDWVPISEVSPRVLSSVITAEDVHFCAHMGVDWDAMRQVIAESGIDGPERGASTIPMQVAKNLFLWQGFGYVRKPVEMLLAHWLELTWSKRRIMEVYLNIAEWGPNGIFGVEAASRYAFRKNAADLGPREAAILATSLPNPSYFNPRRPPPAQVERAGLVAGWAPDADISCLARL